MCLDEDYHWAACYRRGAHDARHRAKAAASEITRRVLLKLAAEYDEMAAEYEQMAGERELRKALKSSE